MECCQTFDVTAFKVPGNLQQQEGKVKFQSING